MGSVELRSQLGAPFHHGEEPPEAHEAQTFVAVTALHNVQPHAECQSLAQAQQRTAERERQEVQEGMSDLEPMC